ncbi:Retrovirus-related Pol polyprotein from transposon TNT 1-94 [Linum grandiflorum]
MASELGSDKSESLSARFNGKNYSLWEFQFRYFVAGKGLLPYLDGRATEPELMSYSKELEKWNLNNAKVFSWIINSVEPRIALTLRTFTSAAAIWSHLEKVYAKASSSRLFELEYELAKLTQSDRDISSFYTAALDLWTEQDLLTTTMLSSAASSEVLAERNRTRVLQFLMKLRPEFESVRSQAIANNVTEMEDILGDLMRVETRLNTQAQLDGSITTFGATGSSTATVFAAGRRPQFYSNNRSGETGSRQTPSFGSAPTVLKCRHCQVVGHVVAHCQERNFCNYCKQSGHIILDCSALKHKPPRQPKSTAFGAQVTSVSPQSSASASASSSSIDVFVQEALSRYLPTALKAAFSAAGISGTSRIWHLDSAAFNHMTSELSLFRNYTPVHNLAVEVANGQQLQVSGIGQVSTPTMELPHTLHVPSLVPNLVSVGQLADNGCVVTFSPSGCAVQDQTTQQQIGRGRKEGRNFYLEEIGKGEQRPQLSSTCFASSSCIVLENSEPMLADSDVCLDNSACLGHTFLAKSVVHTWNLWHSRLGHPHGARLNYMFKHNLLPDKLSLISMPLPTCEQCISAKTVKRPFSSSITNIDDPFDLIHTDLWGPAPVTSRMGYRYFSLFIDHKTRYTWVYFLRHKSDLFQVAMDFVRMVQTQFGKTIKVVRSDPGGEFSSTALQDYYKSTGIQFQQSCLGVSEQNGLVERKHRHVLDLARALLLESGVPPTFWVETVHTVIHLINRQVSPVLGNETPYQALYSKLPNYSLLRVFGCLCFVLLPPHERTKLQSRTARCVFIGYSDHHKGYLCYDPHQRRVRIAYHVVFLEHIPYYSSTTTDSSVEATVTLPSFDDDATSTIETRMDPPEPPPDPTPPASNRPSRSTRGQLPVRFQDFVTYAATPAPSLAASLQIPTSYRQASQDEQWVAAMNEESAALDSLHTFDVVPRPLSHSVLGSRWVYTIKYKPDGRVERYKARVVVQGYKQEYGIDYEETFAPVAKMQTVRTLLAFASQKLWPLYQLDVKNAFLHGDLKETVYMECPPGFDKQSQDVVCRLRRSLYGLKQAPRAWFDKFTQIIFRYGFVQSANDPSLFLRRTSRGITALLIYVDDMVLTGDDSLGISEAKQWLHSHFNLKDLGTLSYFLGLEISRSDRGIFVSQRKYLADLLDAAGFSTCTPVVTPMELNLRLSRDHGDPLPDPRQYRQLVGSLIYLTSTRPDISYAVQVVSQFMSAPRSAHLTAVHRILRYLCGTPRIGIFLPASGTSDITAYANADHAGCLDTRRSTSGWCVMLGDSCVAWRCKKQDRVSKSSTEAEYRSMSDVCSEIVWLARLVQELGGTPTRPASLYADNTSAIAIATNPVFHDRTKHFETHVHFIRELIADGSVRLFYIRTDDQIADLLTKSVVTSRHWFLASKLMCRDDHQFEGRC